MAKLSCGKVVVKRGKNERIMGMEGNTVTATLGGGLEGTAEGREMARVP